ncbi:MAG: IS1 family transposase [Bacteroidales bacterium]|jgi:IS1 family transposase/transposase-like protein|nr:IS1 family transposase [Bacteroidales bacterium]
MKIKIELNCPPCQGTKIKKNGIKSYGKQNYLCKNCGRQFIGDHALKYKGCHSSMIKRILLMMVRGIGVRDITVIEGVSIVKVLSVLAKSCYVIKPKRRHYTSLEVDEFWTYVGKKKNKLWLIYAYDRESGEIVSFVWGKRDVKTVKKLRKKLRATGIGYDRICTDNWESFIIVFKEDNHIIGKKHTLGIEGNNCRLRHRIRRAFRKTCCFSKIIRNHLKAFNLAFFYINFGYV